MKLNPQQAPLYGRCVITVQLADEELAGEEGVDYFLLFAGSTQRHLTSTLRSNHDTLQAVCPAHDCCEVVLVTLCSPCLGRVAPLAEHRFNFVQDLAFDMAQFLVSTAGRADGLDGALLLDECQIPLQECERLDESLALALHHLTLPPGWSLLGRKLTNNTDPNPQETLLHFSARRGLFRVTHFLLQQSGAREALRLANRQGHTPSTIAALRGHEQTEITCLERLQQPSQASQCLDTTTGGNWDENCFVESSSSVDSGHGETGNAEKDWSLSVSTPASEVRPQVHGLGPPEDWVCPSSNTERDYCQTEEEGREQPVVSSQSLSLCDRSEGAQSEAEGESFTVGILPPAGCGKQAEETDRGEAVIREGEEATEGKDISGQEAEDSTAKRREEETNSESTDLITPSGDTKALVMGQTPSSESSNVSDTSDSEMKECCQEGENVEKEEMKLSQEHCDGLSLDEERAESKGLTDPSSTPGDLPNPSLMDYGDVIEEPESAVPRPSIEGLHEGEPPPDINSLEQNQETAGRDYATEQRGLAPETGCHSGNCTGTTSGKELDREDVAQPSGYSIESTTLPSSDEPDDIADCQTTGNSMEDIQTDPSLEPSPEMVPRSSNRQADLDLGITHGLSSDDDGSFQSVGSSTTEIFHPTQDNTCMVNPDLLQTKIAELSSTGLKMEGLNDSKPGENNEPDTGSELTVTDCCQTGTEPESQLSPSLQTMEEGIQTGDTITAGLDSGGGEGGGGGAGEAEEEAKDRVTEVLRRSCLLRNSIRSLSPLRRHSWGPGKNNGGDAEMNQRREKKEKEKEGKEKDKKAINGHLFTTISSGQATQCSQCNKAFNSKDAYHCTRKYLCSFLFLFFSFLKGKVIIVHKLNTNELLMTNTHEIQILSASCVVGEGTEMMDGQLMGEFEAEAKELEADSWSLGVEQQYLQQLDKELVKRQDVIYELMQTEIHHIRTLRIMSEVYSKGLQKEVQLEQQTVEKLFPALDELLELHTQHLLRLLERKREGQFEWGSSEGGFIINRIGDILVSQFSGSNGESMKRVYGKFCSRHNEAVNFYKDLLTKDKRFKAFIKKKMSSSIVRRLGIPECILLVTQRITKYPVLIQRMLQHTKESEEEYDDLTDSVRLVKEVIAAVDSKVNEHEKRRRLKEFHGRMDSKSIMMMKSGQIFAREDLLRRRLIHDGVLQLKNSQGRLKDVHALLLSDVFVFLQEKDQKYVFAMLDQRSTVISLQKLIVREVANEERGLFLITAGIEKPEMMEVLAGTKDERNTWMQLIQEAMQSMEKDEDEGIPSETEDDKRQLETKAKEMRDLLKQKDTEIMSLLEEKVRLFRGMWEGLNAGEEACRQAEPFFRSACSLEPPRGASVMKDALQEVETLQALVNGSLGGAMASVQEGGGAGPVCLPRRAETFGGFDSHQMHSSKSGDRDESEDTAGDLRRTESDSVLKKVDNTWSDSDLICLSFGSGCVQAVVVQQDSFIEDQRQALSERSSSCTSLSRPTSRPSSLIEQEKQRSLEKQRQELASLQRQQAAHAEEKRRREKEWDLREHHLTEREGLEEEVLKQHKELEEQKRELQSKKEEYQKDLERLRDAQRKLERDREAVQRQLDKMQEVRMAEVSGDTLKIIKTMIT
uniref:Si:dkey-172h23.2 n=1 Tax=Dicentrarchus labrax TaxID=13489 RepID=A0A8C4HUA0_DICLA